jgi:hypothetical protein
MTYAERREARAAKLARRAGEAEARATRLLGEADRLGSGMPDDPMYWQQPANRGSGFQKQRDRYRGRLQRAGEARLAAGEAMGCASALQADAERMETPTPEFCARRIAEAEAAIRKIDRNLARLVPGQASEWAEQQQEARAYEAQKLEYWRGKLAEVGGGQVDPKTIRPGDEVKIRGRWRQVLRVYPKTVMVRSEGADDYNPKYAHAVVEQVRAGAAPVPKKTLPPLVNRPSAPHHMTKAEWARTHRDYKGTMEQGGVRIRTILRQGLVEVFLTDALEKLG